MKTTHTDPIVAEIRAIRQAYAAQFDYDVDAMFRDIRSRQDASGHDYVSHPPRRVQQPETVSTSEEDEATFGYYMVGVFDVLGQSRKLRAQAGALPCSDPAELQRLVANLQDTAGVVLGFRRGFRKFFVSAALPTGRTDVLPEPQRSEMLAAVDSRLLLWGVSDTVFVAAPVDLERHPAAVAGDVFHSLLAAATMWLAGLSTNNPVRGGMEIGTGIDVEHGEIYGQGLEAAYRLESQVALGPRIVVGPKCVGYLEDVRRGESTAIRHKMAANIAALCLSMLRRDADGCTVVDGLGQAMLHQSRDVPDLHDWFSQAHDNVRTQYRSFRAAGNAKLASRYEALCSYFDERAPDWRVARRN